MLIDGRQIGVMQNTVTSHNMTMPMTSQYIWMKTKAHRLRGNNRLIGNMDSFGIYR